MKPTLLACSAALLAMTGLAAGAASPAKTIQDRVANFKTMGKSMKAISDQLRTPAADMAAISFNAKIIADASHKVGNFFPRGTGPEAGVKTGALPAIWAKPTDFKTAAAKLVAATKQLQAAGTVDQAKAAFPQVGASCKGCHDSFRAKD